MKNSNRSATALVLMSFDDGSRPYYDEVLRPAIEEAGLDCVRADDDSRPGWIRETVWLYIRDAAVVVADLTSRIENVMYEIALAHAALRPVVLIAEHRTEIPLYLRDLNIIKVDRTDADWRARLHAAVARQVADAVSNPAAVLACFREGGVPRFAPAPQNLREARERIAQLRNVAEARQFASLAIHQGGMPANELRPLLEEKFGVQQASIILDTL
ncbi:MAG TPA: hypothetical protein VEO54_11375 [Thermoanaerobaculia bacterium]|nr:hypothetical protein [Thermoanaerobaculia bacterium]